MPSTDDSRRPPMMRKYLDAAMLTLVSDQEAGARMPFCSKITLPSAFLMMASCVRQVTVSKAVLPRGTRRGTGIGSRPTRGAGREPDGSGEDEDDARFFDTAIEDHSGGDERSVRTRTAIPLRGDYP